MSDLTSTSLAGPERSRPLRIDYRVGSPGWFCSLVRHKRSWSPRIIAAEIWRLFQIAALYPELLKVIGRQPASTIVRHTPGFAFKYLVPRYLSASFTATDSAACFVHHYMRLHTALSSTALSRLSQGDILLHEWNATAGRLDVVFGITAPWDKEGELSIRLDLNGQCLFVLSFAIVPGRVLHLDVAEAVLITRLQGTPRRYTEMRLATKMMHDVHPRALLFTAVEGVADALGISEIAAVNAANQFSFSEASAASLRSSYDDFFSQLMMWKTKDGLFYSGGPLDEKPINSVKQGHRIRTREKRNLKRQIRQSCASTFSTLLA